MKYDSHFNELIYILYHICQFWDYFYWLISPCSPVKVIFSFFFVCLVFFDVILHYKFYLVDRIFFFFNFCTGMQFNYLESVWSFYVLILSIFRWGQKVTFISTTKAIQLWIVLWSLLWLAGMIKNYSRSCVRSRDYSACFLWWFFPYLALEVFSHACAVQYSAEDWIRTLSRSLELFSITLSPLWYSELWTLVTLASPNFELCLLIIQR